MSGIKRAAADPWLRREVQLNELHEEIIARREALLRVSCACSKKQGGERSPAAPGEALERNRRLMQEIKDMRNKLNMQTRSPSTRFTRLKDNYWSMVANIRPLWEEELSQYQKKRASQ